MVGDNDEDDGNKDLNDDNKMDQNTYEVNIMATDASFL